MGDVSGQARALTVFTPIEPGHVVALRGYLDAMPTGADSPLARVRSTHFARWVIMPQLIYEGRPQRRDLFRLPYLVFTSNFDGELEPYLDAITTEMPSEAHEIWRHCVGYPGEATGAAFKDYLRRHSVPNTFFLSAYPEATVDRVRGALEQKKRFLDFATRAQAMEPEELRATFLEELA